jgi:hypothetical protein
MLFLCEKKKEKFAIYASSLYYLRASYPNKIVEWSRSTDGGDADECGRRRPLGW